MDQRPPLPPFTFETAVEKVRKAENVVATYRQIDLCSEHAKRLASVPGLWWCKGPIVGIANPRSPIYRVPWRADANCPSPRSPHALDDASLDELRRR